MTSSDLIKSIIDEAGAQFVSVTFVKANGEERQLTFNPKHIGEIKGTGSSNQNPNVFKVMDIKLNQWRSFRADRVIKIKVSGQVKAIKEVL
ncbi:MAG TPA: hypothetical protein DCW74_19725 [Alteromonas australica]|uniref:WYL domain-containing protein n=1 Tax=Alteromonas australica TaxID=589873 RepID=A0A350P9I6_9ALTE|nr:hypothetical protein [Alteromonas australica]|tara:strand:- start:597 stop:869 length:273 start_codon:yes stop_codon:yes gene_type:complete